MHPSQRFLLGAAILLQAAAAWADEVRYYQENGVTYCETRRAVQRLVTEMKLQQVTRTTYKEDYYSETRDVNRTSWTPTTVYRTDTYWKWWDLFEEPRWETQYTPETLWTPKAEVVKMPVTCRRLVPTTEQVQVSVPTQRVVTEQVVVSRVPVPGPIPRSTPGSMAPVYPAPVNSAPVNPPPANAAPSSAVPPAPLTPSSAARPVGPIGGIARLQQDPPRYGTGVGSQGVQSK
jgi:hypothetical protein